MDYTVIGSRYDIVTTPYESTFLKAGAGATVTNVTLQDGCEADTSDHLAMTYSPRTVSLVLRAVGGGAGQVPIVCAPKAWLVG